MNWHDFHFLRPWWLLALLPLAACLWRARRGGGNGGAWEKVVEPGLLPYLLIGETRQGKRWPLWLAGLGFLFAILALAGPAWEKVPQPVYRSGDPLVILFDLSRSMEARDLKPSRLARARFKVEDLLRQRREGETALVAFAGEPFTVVPLTDDVKTIRAQLPALATDLMPVQGSNLAAAIEAGIRLLRQAGRHRGRLLLVTDGLNDPDAAASAARRARESGYTVLVLGVGTVAGAPIPTSSGLLEDSRGNIVVARLDEEALRSVAKAGGGRYARITLDGSDLQRLGLLEESGALQVIPADRQAVAWRDRGPWLLLAILPLAALAFRRGVLSLLLVALLLPLPQESRAGWWQDLWLRPDQQGARLMQHQQAEEAARRFKDPHWKASARYRAGDYAGAARIWSRGHTADDRYNLGNALARQGRLKAAIEAYEEALKLDPGLEDARANKALLEKLLRQQRQKPKSGGKGKQARNQDGKQHQGKADRRSGRQQSKGQENEPQQGRPKAAGQSTSQGRQGRKQAASQTGEKHQGQQKRRKNPKGSPRDTASQGGQQEPSRAEKEKLQQQFRRQMEAERKQRRKAGEAGGEPGGEAEHRERRKVAVNAGEGRPSRDERAMAREQWLKRIPDDPGELLRRKFRYYYQRQKHETATQNPW